jgi:hypothetical protein
VQKLLDARIIREVQYPVWVANVVMVLKKNGHMRMCIDFTELNKACPKALTHYQGSTLSLIRQLDLTC